jgi:hypothetical protein
VDGFLRDAKYLIHDRDPLFTEAFATILGERGVKCVKIPAQSPNCNPHAERFVKTIRYECLNQFVFFEERHLRHVVKELMAHCHAERFHQGLGGQLIQKPAGSAKEIGVHGIDSFMGGASQPPRSASADRARSSHQADPRPRRPRYAHKLEVLLLARRLGDNLAVSLDTVDAEPWNRALRVERCAFCALGPWGALLRLGIQTDRRTLLALRLPIDQRLSN